MKVGDFFLTVVVALLVMYALSKSQTAAALFLRVKDSVNSSG